MVGKIKVNLIDETHSVGRGVGFYAQFLKEALSHLPSVELTRKNPDIVHYPYFDLFYPTLPFIKKIPSIVTIHDLNPLVFPKLYPKGIRAMMALFWQRIALGNVSAIVTDSLASKRDIVKLFNVNPKKVFVTPLSVDPVFQEEPTPKQIAHVKAKYDLPEKFVLYVGDVNYNKNLFGLAEACKQANIPLVIVGKQAKSEEIGRKHIENRPFVRFLHKFGADPSIIRVGFVPDEDLAVIYNLATLYCQPSFYQGFGLAVLEAFASGCPVISSKVQALVEIGEPACVFFDPKDPKNMAEKISTVLADEVLRNQLTETAKVFVKNYSWEKTARETLNVYKEARFN